MNIMELNNISKVYCIGDAEVHALDSISLSIAEGEFVAIMGASGSGKSTLLHLLGLLDKPCSGSYKLVGREVSLLSDDELASLRNKFMGFIFQSFNLLSRMSAKENVALPKIYFSGKKPRADEAEMLNKVGLAGRIKHKPNELSGGQQQRVANARALINNPMLILADEPTGNLDTKSAAEIINILNELNKSGITIVMVTHEHIGEDILTPVILRPSPPASRHLNPKPPKPDRSPTFAIPGLAYPGDSPAFSTPRMNNEDSAPPAPLTHQAK